MCKSSSVAVEIIKQKKTLTKGDIIMLFEKAVEDIRTNGEEVAKIKSDVADIKTEMAKMSEAIHGISAKLNEKGWASRFWDKYGDKIALFVIAAGTCALLGISFPEIRAFLLGG